MAITLVINTGSTSKKYALYEQRKVVLEFRFEKTTTGFESCVKKVHGVQNCVGVTQTDFDAAFSQVATGVNEYLQEHGKTLDTICVRVVAPGAQFSRHGRIDAPYLASLRQAELTSPLHIPTMLQDIHAAKQAFPQVTMVAASDSAFHDTLPERAREFSIDRSDAALYDIHRFGYHGLSVASVVRRVHPVTGLNPERMVIVHVGGGVSVTALKKNTSIDTSMGYAPASGLPMGSRAGDLDSSALLRLMRAKNLRPSEAEMYLYTKGGLAGLSDDADIRRLLDRRAKGDAVAIQALDLFVYHLQKAVAAMTVPLGGLDMIVLTGTACSRSSELRTLILSNLGHLGVTVDQNRNDAIAGNDGLFNKKDGVVKVVSIRTDEMGEMALIAEQVGK